MLEPGSHVGAYELLSVLGTGRTGVVYRAYDTVGLRHVVLRVLNLDIACDRGRMQRLRHELTTLAQHADAFIVNPFEVRVAGPVTYLVSDFLAGVTLQSVLGTPFPASNIARYAADIACGLATAHGLGIAHGNIKPENIFIERGDGRARLLDFSLEAAVNGGRHDEPDLQRDIVALGTALTTMLAAVPPFDDTPTGLAGAVARVAHVCAAPVPPDAPSRAASLACALSWLVYFDQHTIPWPDMPGVILQWVDLMAAPALAHTRSSRQSDVDALMARFTPDQAGHGVFSVWYGIASWATQAGLAVPERPPFTLLRATM